MTVPWSIKFAQKTNPLLLPCLWVALSTGYFALVFLYSEGESYLWDTRLQAWGTSLVYCLIPAYLLACSYYSWAQLKQAMEHLVSQLDVPLPWLERVMSPPLKLLVICTLLGSLYGLSQNILLFAHIQDSENLWLDYSMLVANIITFSCIGAMLARRLYAHTGLRQVGYQVQVNLYKPESLRPFVDVALRDVLVVMGALAFLPLQSLDAEFRWYNYEAGLIIGVLAVIAFLSLPMWGVHRNIQKVQASRLLEIESALDSCDRGNIEALEKLLAHRDRIQSMPSWPLDFRLLSRAAFYLVIPPLAWTGAALVENLVGQFIQ
jgi:hypothetical protein